MCLLFGNTPAIPMYMLDGLLQGQADQEGLTRGAASKSGVIRIAKQLAGMVQKCL